MQAVTQIEWSQVGYAVMSFLVIILFLTATILLVRSFFVQAKDCFICINNDPELIKRVKAGQTLLQALTKAGIPIPSPCGGKASCKQCRLRVVEGGQPPLETDSATFTKAQLQDGWRLSCQVKVRNDMSVIVDEQFLNVREWRATVISNENVATFIKELVVELEPGEHINYKPGGFLEIYIPKFVTNTSEWKESIDPQYVHEWEKYGMLGQQLDFSSCEEQKRAYSLASYPGEKEKLIFNVRIATPPLKDGKVSKEIPWGFGSSYLFSLKPGDTIRVAGPFGHSFMIDDERDVYFLIGGAGSSFCRSHIFNLFKNKKTNRRVSMWYGARSLKENIYQEDYEEMEAMYPHFSYHLVLSEPTKEDIEGGWSESDPLKTNFLFKAFEKGELSRLEEPEEALYYVCGPPLHNTSVMKMLDDYGVPRDNIIIDDFGS